MSHSVDSHFLHMILNLKCPKSDQNRSKVEEIKTRIKHNLTTSLKSSTKIQTYNLTFDRYTYLKVLQYNALGAFEDKPVVNLT